MTMYPGEEPPVHHHLPKMVDDDDDDDDDNNEDEDHHQVPTPYPFSRSTMGGHPDSHPRNTPPTPHHHHPRNTPPPHHHHPRNTPPPHNASHPPTPQQHHHPKRIRTPTPILLSPPVQASTPRKPHLPPPPATPSPPPPLPMKPIPAKPFDDDDSDDDDREDNRRRAAAVIVTILILLALAVLILWLVYRPHRPIFTAVATAVYSLNATTPPPFVAAAVQFTVITHNPNKRTALYYEGLTATVYYRNNPITPPVRLPPLVLRQRSSVMISPVVGGGPAPAPMAVPVAVAVAEDVAAGLVADEGYGVVGLSWVLTGRWRYRAGKWYKSGRSRVYVRCDVLVGLRGGGVGGYVNPTGQVPLLGTPPCLVDM